MTITTFSSREFNQAASEAKRAANSGPVFITDRGRPAHVLMSIAHYQSLTASRKKIADLLAMTGLQDADFEAPLMRDLAKPADFS
jgi:prevent-host-death family protein